MVKGIELFEKREVEVDIEEYEQAILKFIGGYECLY